MKVSKQCKTCKKIFRIKNSHNLFCSFYCSALFKKERMKKYRQIFKNRISLQAKKYKEEHKEGLKKLNKIYYNKNRTYILNKYRDKYKDKYRDIKRTFSIKYRKLHRNSINLQRRFRRKKDINFKIISNLRCRLYQALNLNIKTTKTINLINCSIDSLKKHLESKFTIGMSWSNYGKWHIDHIRPCASFDLSDTEQQKICFNYINLQPLWAEDNYVKGSKNGRTF